MLSHQQHLNDSRPSNGSFARKAARIALAPNKNIINIQQNHNKSQMKQLHHQSIDYPLSKNEEYEEDGESTEIDKIVESVTNATKRLSQISTNTNSSKRKSKNHVGPWRLGRTLGRGSTGRVRLAKHSETGKLAAVKIVPKSKIKRNDQDSSDDDNKNASPYGIEREIIIMKLISHPNIMGLYDVWENKGELYLVLEYVEGGELFDYLIKKGKLPEKEAVHYFRQIINGVSYCHQFNICHRDLKPENLLLDKNLNIKIADFGMAALELNQKLLETSCGSPHYASPEIVTGKTYHGSPSDVWSCGIILFALLTGHLPFDDENIRKLLMKVQSGKFVMPNYLSAEAKDLIWKMLKVNPDDRIHINDIAKHPLLRHYETSTVQKSKVKDKQKLESYYSEVDTLRLTKNDIDRDLLKSLSILFHGADEASLVQKLLLTKSSPEKVFYYLLYKYKKQHQVKERDEVTQKNSKNKIGNGDGLLKKSKSTVKTTITNEDGSTIVKTETKITTQQPLLLTPRKLKRVSKGPTGQLQIPASNSSRRGVSFNNKQINSDQMSRSSSRKSLASAAAITFGTTVNSGSAQTSKTMNKRHSILPPLPDLGVDWLSFDNDGTPSSNEFAALYDEIFNYRATPKKKSSQSRQPSPKKDLPKTESFVTSTPMELPQIEPKETGISEEDELSEPLKIEEPRKALQHTPSKPLPRQLGNFEISNKRAITDPVTTTSKPSTLDPMFKSRAISSNNEDILNKIGVSLRRELKTSSKIYYSKSSTSINLAAILERKDSSATVKRSNLTAPPLSEAPPLPKHRISSSNYNSFEDESALYANETHGVSFDFEVPTKTEIATAIHISNGSNITVGKRIKPREESIFEDVAGLVTPTENITTLPSDSYNSIVRRHKKAKSVEHKFIAAPSTDIRGSLFNNPSDLRDDKTMIPHSTLLDYPNPRHSQFNRTFTEDTETSLMENSLFADNTEDFNDEFANAKRVTMIFDDQDDDYDNGEIADTASFYDFSMGTPVKKDALSDALPHKPLHSSPLKSIQQKNFVQSADGTLKRADIDLKPQRVAPSAPVDSKTVSPTDSTKIKKSNWFTKFFSSLMSSSSTSTSSSKSQQKANEVKVFKSSIPMNILKRGIDDALRMKKKEGTLTALTETGDFISATIPATFALGKPLKFEISFHKDEVHLRKVKGSKKIFKSLIGAMEFVIENETRKFKDTE